MATDGRDDAVLDTSTLVNFLAVDRVDLLGRHPAYRFTITEHVRGEVTAHYPEQLERLEHALSGSLLEVAQLDSLDPTFVMLVKEGRLGIGECAAIALAVAKGCPLVIDDKKAAKTAGRVAPKLHIERTETVVVSLIRAGVLDVATADTIKAEWEAKHRFKLMFGSFAEKV
jgi:predicted nucleic acid-binding protein